MESPPNVSITRTINASSSSQFVTEVPTTAHQRQRRYILPNNTDAGDDDKHCNLVKPLNYSLYTNKPFELLLSDFISGVVSAYDQHLDLPYLNIDSCHVWECTVL